MAHPTKLNQRKIASKLSNGVKLDKRRKSESKVLFKVLHVTLGNSDGYTPIMPTVAGTLKKQDDRR